MQHKATDSSSLYNLLHLHSADAFVESDLRLFRQMLMQCAD